MRAATVLLVVGVVYIAAHLAVWLVRVIDQSVAGYPAVGT